MEDFRVLITEKCNANCPNCFNKNIRCGREMSFEDFKSVCDYLSNEGRIKRLKIMGGEPTVHPFFCECVEYAQKRFDSVHIFTNAINDQIEKINLREHDSVIYNVSCLPINISPSKYLFNQKGGRMFETQISSDANVDHIKEVLCNAKKLIPPERMNIALTLNCVENIFAEKDKIILKWNEVSSFVVNELNVDYKIDHNIPYCFFVGSKMDIHLKHSLCSTRCSGLITSDLKLQYCNQSQEILDDILVDNRFIPFEIVENRLDEFFHKKMTHNLQKVCRNCIFYGKKCNGGCFMHKSIISKESVLENTDLPIV